MLIRKTISVFAAAALSVALLCPAASAQNIRFGFKLTGGFSYQLGGDSDAYLRGVKLRGDDYIASSGYTQDQFVTPLVSHLGLEFDADAIVMLSPQFGVTIGTGYVRAGTLFGSGTQIIDDGVAKETDANDVAATATPVKIGVYYTFQSSFVPTGGKSSSYVFGGVGFYSAKFAQTENWTYQDAYTIYTETSKASGVGFFAGFGTENWINPNFAFIMEFYGRLANITGFKGDWQLDSNGGKLSGSGTLYAYEWQDSGSGKWYPTIEVRESAPAGASVRNAQQAKIDFSGLGIRFGIKVAL